MSEPRHISNGDRVLMVEQIMALIGRGSSDPKSYRRTLESFETETLARTLRELTETESEFSSVAVLAGGHPFAALTESPLQSNASPTTSINGTKIGITEPV